MRGRGFLGSSAGLFLADQVMKTYVEQNMDKGAEKQVTGPLVLRRVHNKGMCMNLFDEQPGAVRALSLTASAALTVFYLPTVFRKGRFLQKTGLSLMVSGAWSNTFDRCKRGAVVDYIGFACGNKKLSEITYNLGDFFLLAGGILTTASSMLYTRKQHRGRQSGSDREMLR